MKMKKLLAGVLAGAMAVSAVTFTSITLSAADDPNEVVLYQYEAGVMNDFIIDKSYLSQAENSISISLEGENGTWFNAQTVGSPWGGPGGGNPVVFSKADDETNFTVAKETGIKIYSILEGGYTKVNKITVTIDDASPVTVYDILTAPAGAVYNNDGDTFRVTADMLAKANITAKNIKACKFNVKIEAVDSGAEFNSYLVDEKDAPSWFTGIFGGTKPSSAETYSFCVPEKTSVWNNDTHQNEDGPETTTGEYSVLDKGFYIQFKNMTVSKIFITTPTIASTYEDATVIIENKDIVLNQYAWTGEHYSGEHLFTVDGHNAANFGGLGIDNLTVKFNIDSITNSNGQEIAPENVDFSIQLMPDWINSQWFNPTFEYDAATKEVSLTVNIKNMLAEKDPYTTLESISLLAKVHQDNTDSSVTIKIGKKINSVSEIILNKETLTVEKGKTAQLEATVLPENATDPTVTWTSSNTEVATVDEATGEITALSEGTTTITAAAGEQTAVCEVTVASVSLTDLALKVGDEAAAPEAVIKPEDIEILWSTDDEEGNVITIDEATGKVTPVASGTANVTATIKGTEISASCKVTVTNPLTKINLDAMNIVKGAEDSEITYTTVPAKPDAFTATFESSDTAVFTVVENSGKFYVHAVEVGEADLIAKVDAKEVGRCTVKVTDKLVPAESVELDKTALELKVGDTDVLKATVSPADSTDKIVWTSDKPDIASVENGTVTANAAGTATITAAAGEKTATCTVTVNEKTIAITSVSLDKTEATVVEGETVELTATVKPDTATEDKTVTWTSSDETIATVKDGLVTAVSEGKATITAAAGTKSASCEITVTKKAEDTKPDDTKPEEPKPEEPGETFTTYELNEAERAMLSDPKTTFVIKYNSPNGWNDIGFGASTADGGWASASLPAQQGEGTLTVTVEELIPQMKVSSLEGVSYFKVEGYNGTVFTSVEVKASTGEEPGPDDGKEVVLFEGEGKENVDIKINTIKKYKDSAIITVKFTTAAAEPEGQTLDDCNFGSLAASNNTGAGGWWSQPVDAAYWNKTSSEGINAWGDTGTFKTTVADYVKNLQDCENISEIATAWACPWNGTVINKVTIEGELAGGTTPPDDTTTGTDSPAPTPTPGGSGSFTVPGTAETTAPDTTTPPAAEGSVTPETTQLVNGDSTVKVEFAAGSVKTGAVLDVKKGAETATSATYDITLKLANAAIQPDGTLTITISVPANLLGADNYYVYRAETDGSYTDMMAAYADGKVTFKTGHLSEYVISTVKLTDTGIADGSSSDSAQNPDEGIVNTGNADSDPTGENTGSTDGGKNDDKNVATGAALALVPAAAAAAAVIIFKKRK